MLLQHMKKDKIFNDLFQNVNYAGSVSKSLKVYKPNEYDLNLVIRLPINYKFLTVILIMNAYVILNKNNDKRY